MNININNHNLLAGAFVKRQIQTQTSVSDNYYSEVPEGLPFYYYMDFRICILLIILGIVAGIIQLAFMFGFFFIPFMKKNNEFRCIKCMSFFKQFKNPKVCPYCGGQVIKEKDYLKQQKLFDNLYKSNLDK